MIKYYIPEEIYSYINIVSFLLAIFLFYKRPYRNAGIYASFLFMVVLVELMIGVYFEINYNNNWPVYNVYSVLCQFFYIYFFSTFFVRESIKLSIHIHALTIAWILLCLLMLLLKDLSHRILVVNYLFGYFISSIYVYFMLLEIIKKNLKPYLIPEFYLAIGVIVFFVCSFPIIVFLNTLFGEGSNSQAALAYGAILKVGNIFLSLGYLSMILCEWKVKNYTT